MVAMYAKTAKKARNAFKLAMGDRPAIATKNIGFFNKKCYK
jgi:hypothetical protein